MRRNSAVGESGAIQSLSVRIAVFIFAFSAWVFGFFIFKPWFAHVVKPALSSLGAGPRTFFSHVLIYSFPTALISAAAWLGLVKAGYLRGPRWGYEPRKALVQGLILGLAIASATIVVAPVAWGFKVYLELNVWPQAGNLFSNTWEEMQYRGLIYLASLMCFRNRYAAAVISGLVFGLTHEQYPLSAQAFVAAVGFVLALSYERTQNFLTPVVGHIVVDLVCDLFLH